MLFLFRNGWRLCQNSQPQEIISFFKNTKQHPRLIARFSGISPQTRLHACLNLQAAVASHFFGHGHGYHADTCHLSEAHENDRQHEIWVSVQRLGLRELCPRAGGQQVLLRMGDHKSCTFSCWGLGGGYLQIRSVGSRRQGPAILPALPSHVQMWGSLLCRALSVLPALSGPLCMLGSAGFPFVQACTYKGSIDSVLWGHSCLINPPCP